MAGLDPSEWCCPLFYDAVEGRDKGPFAIVIVNVENVGLGFLLEFRVVPKGEEHKLTITCPIPVRLTAWNGIRFCPWCGQRLVDFYSEYSDQLPLHQDVLEQILNEPKYGLGRTD